VASGAPESGRRRRPRALALVFLGAAIAFWILGPPPLPGERDSTPSPSPEPTETPAGEAGGYKDGRGEVDSAPPARAPVVSPVAADDHVLRLVVLGDEQAAQWAPDAAQTLQSRLAALPSGPWRGAAVDLTVAAHEGWTSAHAVQWLQAEGWATRPELVVVALGWHDGGTDEAPTVDGDHAGAAWLTELAEQPVVGLPQADGRFFLRGPIPAIEPLRHLQLLDRIGLEGAANGAAVVYVEQPIRYEVGPRRVLPSTGMRPQPWISTVFGIEAQPEPQALFDAQQPQLLSPAGVELMSRFVGVGLVQTVIGEGR